MKNNENTTPAENTETATTNPTESGSTQTEQQGPTVIGKVTELEREKLQVVQNKKNAIQGQLVDIGTMEYNIKKKKENVHRMMDEVQQEEFVLLRELQNKYGEGLHVDLATGSITKK